MSSERDEAKMSSYNMDKGQCRKRIGRNSVLRGPVPADLLASKL